MSDVMEVKQARRVAVWDPVVRYGHWLLVAAFALAYLSAEEGPAAEALCRPRQARFTDFVYNPATASRYLVDLVRGRARRYLGHSPTGGAMVVLLLLSLAATVVTGLVAYGEGGRGPLAAAGPTVVAAAYADEDEAGRRLGVEIRRNGEKGESALGEVHSMLANVTLALVIVHVLRVGLASVVHRENLVLAMIDGRKRRDGQGDSDESL